MTGVKFDTDKIRMELVPGFVTRALASVLTFGAKKYGDYNWAGGMDWSRLYGAAQRHLGAWWDGEGTDPETGMSHLWHALCCVAFLTAYEIKGIGRDDRFKWGGPAPVSARELLERHCIPGERPWTPPAAPVLPAPPSAPVDVTPVITWDGTAPPDRFEPV